MHHAHTLMVGLRRQRICISALLFVVYAGVAFGQTQPPVTVEHVSFPDFPIEVLGLEVAGAPYNFSEGPQADFNASHSRSEIARTRLSSVSP